MGKRFGDAGLSDLLIESDVIGSGSLNGVLDGRQYNRATRLHKLVMEALERTRWESFGRWLQTDESSVFLIDEEQKALLNILHEFRKSPSHDQFDCLFQSKELDTMLSEYLQYCRRDHGPMKTYWSSYIEMVGLLLAFIRATREGNWELHLACIKEMIPWFFAYDRHNYSRYLPVYWLHMSNLQDTHPEAHQYLSTGGFCVQRSSFGFSQCAVDQTIEQTLNRDTKTKGGIIGFSLNKSAVKRWLLNAHERAAISNKCKELAGIDKQCSMAPKEIGLSRKVRDESDVRNLKTTLESWNNPFETSDQLCGLSSGIVASDDLVCGLISAYDKGRESSEKFFNERLLSNNIGFHEPIRKLSLQTFSEKNKKVPSAGAEKQMMIKADRNLFARLLVIAQTRDLNMREVLQFELGPVPWSIATVSGSLVKTNKSTLVHSLETPEDLVQNITGNCALVVDGMFVIQSITRLPDTFGELANVVLDTILSFTSCAKRIDFVSDQYPEISIKNTERERRGFSGHIITKITRPSQPVPRQWKKFLSFGKNKIALIEFFIQEWAKQCGNLKFQGKELFVSEGEKCHKLSVENGQMTHLECPELFSDQEEADTRMFLHGQHCAEHGHSNIVIRSSDTDVEVLACYFQQYINAKLYIVAGGSSKSRIIDVSSVVQRHGPDVCNALPGFHAVTGCDTISAFSGKGKTKSFNMMVKKKDFADTLSSLGENTFLSDDLLQGVERFICGIYGLSSSDINEVRFLLFCKSKNVQCHHLPPTKDALRKHVLRSNYQTKVWKSALQAYPDLPSPDNQGWKLKDDILKIHWLDSPPALESLMVLISCGCKSGCTTRRCSCLSQGMSCTDGCKCSLSCKNCEQSIQDFPTDDSEDEEEITEN